jgi:hypothetical protein
MNSDTTLDRQSSKERTSRSGSGDESTGKVGLNLDIEQRHWLAGAEATRKQRERLAREKRAALIKGEVVIRQEHRLAGAKNANRAKERSKSEEDCETRPERAKPVLAPFARSHRALADLCSVFGYPPAVVPVFGPVRVHRIKVPEDNHSPDPRPQNMPRAARPKHSDIYRVRHGVQERLCRSCGQWLPLTLDHYRWRNDRATGSWNGECRPCDNLRRRETIARRQAGD